MNWFSILLMTFLVAGLSACKKDRGIQVYKVEKQRDDSVNPITNPHGVTLPRVDLPNVAGAEGGDAHAGLKLPKAPAFTDAAPEHWTPKPLTAMRMASYQIQGEEGGAVADVSFTTLRSAPKSLLANINRWRDQVGQAPWSDEELEKNSVKVATHFGEAVMVDVAGLVEKGDPNTDGRIVAAIAEKDGRSWFYKMRGNADLVGMEKANFLNWIPTLVPKDVIELVEPAAATNQKSQLSWRLPAAWMEAVGGSSRYATITVPSETGNVTSIAVSFFPGDVGGDVANVNRWRGQIALPPMEEAKVLTLIEKIEAGGKSFSWVDLQGPRSRLIAAWVKHGGRTWFFKWTGDQAALESNKEPFRVFIQSIRFPPIE